MARSNILGLFKVNFQSWEKECSYQLANPKPVVWKCHKENRENVLKEGEAIGSGKGEKQPRAEAPNDTSSKDTFKRVMRTSKRPT